MMGPHKPPKPAYLHAQQGSGHFFTMRFQPEFISLPAAAPNATVDLCQREHRVSPEEPMSTNIHGQVHKAELTHPEGRD